jgi:hypothetical protein
MSTMQPSSVQSCGRCSAMVAPSAQRNGRPPAAPCGVCSGARVTVS